MKVLAVASFGGHWIQLRSLRPLLDKFNTVYVSTNNEINSDAVGSRYFSVADASTSAKFKLLIQLAQLIYIFIVVRPKLVISTGASVGFFSVLLGKLFLCKTVWIDSVANYDQLSKSGELARKYSDIWLSQWEHVANQSGASYLGKVL